MAKKPKTTSISNGKKGTSYTPKMSTPKGKDHLWRIKNALKGK